MFFRDRADAGRKLAKRLIGYRNLNPVVIALPRGGVPIGCEVASALNAPLDIVLVRKIGVPFQPELALGAVIDGDNPEIVINEQLKDRLEVSDSFLREESATQVAEIERRRKLYLGRSQPFPISGRVVIVVDDGIATGATMRAALRGIRRRQPASIILAVPVAPQDAVEMLRREADEVVCLFIPEEFSGVGQFYEDFSQVDDATVVASLRNRSPASVG